jgi:hypothetical protein
MRYSKAAMHFGRNLVEDRLAWLLWSCMHTREKARFMRQDQNIRVLKAFKFDRIRKRPMHSKCRIDKMRERALNSTLKFKIFSIHCPPAVYQGELENEHKIKLSNKLV